MAESSRVYLYDCEVAGSSGQAATLSLSLIPPEISAPGGLLSGSMLFACGSIISGGSGGGDPDGADGQDFEVLAGAVDLLPGTARGFSAASPVLQGSATALHLEGEPGDAVLLHVQLAASTAHFLPALGIAVHLPFPHAVIDLGPLPPSGALDLDSPVPPLAPGVESFRAVGQAVCVGATGVFDGGPSTLLIVGAAL